MGASTRLGVKVERELRERLHSAALRMACTPHALNKRALLNLLDRVDRGELHCLNDIEPAGLDNIMTSLSGGFGVFAEFYQEVQQQSVLRAAISASHRRTETQCLPLLISLVRTPSAESVALMCLAEALLRIPDQASRDALIRDKVSKGNWRSQVGDTSVLVNAATWGLLLTGKLVVLNSEQTLSTALTRPIGKGGEPLIRRGVDLVMRMLSEQFVCGQHISQALDRAAVSEKQGFRYYFDMLGEAAMTAAIAQSYVKQYEQAIHAIGKAACRRGIYEGNGISIKLSAIHPRYQRAARKRVLTELYPRLLSLVELAHFYDIGINIDAGDSWPTYRLVQEKSICINTAAAGGNASLMMLA